MPIDSGILEKLREQQRLFPEAAKDAGFRSPEGRGSQWIAKTAVLISHVDPERGARFEQRGADLLRVGSGTGSQAEFNSLLVEVPLALSVVVARLAEEAPQELEQKFRILFSPQQAEKDFEVWRGRLGRETPIAVLFLDLDHFKDLNTRFTEERVDREFLPSMMHLLRDASLERGRAYKQGGDESLILLPNCDIDEAYAFAERLLNAVRQQVFTVRDTSVQITASVGVASAPCDGSDLRAVREKANAEKNVAKETRDCVRPVPGRG